MLVIYPAFLEFKEIMIILVVAVLIFGPDKIPEIARGLGQAVRKMKEATEDIKQEILNPASELDPTKEIRETLSDLDPTKQVSDALESANPLNDLTKAFEEPVNELEKAVTEQETTTSVDPAKEVKDIIELAKSETEIQAEQELGNGGSVSR